MTVERVFLGGRGMADTLFFVYPDAAQCENVAAEFRGRGWATQIASPRDEDALERIAASQQRCRRDQKDGLNALQLR